MTFVVAGFKLAIGLRRDLLEWRQALGQHLLLLRHQVGLILVHLQVGHCHVGVVLVQILVRDLGVLVVVVLHVVILAVLHFCN